MDIFIVHMVLFFLVLNISPLHLLPLFKNYIASKINYNLQTTAEIPI